MRRQKNRLLLSLVTAGLVAVACAGEEQDSDFSGGKGGSGGSGGSTTGKGGSGGSGGSTISKGGSSGSAGSSSGGSSGSGGSTAGSGGSTAGTNAGGAPAGGSGGEPDLGACDVGGASFGDGVLRADFQAGSLSTTQNPGGTVHIYNDTGSAMAESEFTFRYYFTSEFACDDADEHSVEVYDFRRQNPHDDTPGKSDVDVTTVVIGDNGGGCDAYFEFVFSVDLADGQYAAFNWGSTPPDYNTAANQSNDASFGSCSTEPVPWTATPVYVNDVLTWGEEPDSGGGGQGGGGAGGAGGATAGAGGA
jgi:hypothetical protein